MKKKKTCVQRLLIVLKNNTETAQIFGNENFILFFVSYGKMLLATYFMLWPISCNKKFLELDRGYSM